MPKIDVSFEPAAGKSYDLAALGGLDWETFRAGTTTLVKKNGGAGIVGTFQNNGTNAFSGSGTTVSYTGGPPEYPTGSNTGGVFGNGAVGSGRTWVLPADKLIRRFHIVAGAYEAVPDVTVTLSDGSVQEVVNASLAGSGQGHWIIDYAANAANQTCTVKIGNRIGSGNVNLQGAALEMVSLPAPTKVTTDAPSTGIVNAAPVVVNIALDGPAPAGGATFAITGTAGTVFNPANPQIAAGDSFGSFQLSATTTGVKTVQIANNIGLPPISFDWDVRIPKPTGSFTSQTLDGQRLTVKISYGDAPASGSVTIPPAASNPNGAVAQGPFPMVLSGGVGTAVCDITAAGNYGQSLTTLVNDGGSFDIRSPDGVSLQSVDGSGEGTGGTEQPVGEAPTVTIVNAVGGVNSINASGSANLKGDASGSLTASYVPRDGSASIGPEAIAVSNGSWTLSKTGVSQKTYDLVMSVTANNQQATATAGPLTVTAPPTGLVDRSITLDFVDDNGQPVTTLAGMNWRWFDTTSLLGGAAPVSWGTAGSGMVLTYRSALTIGATGHLEISSSTGDPAVQFKAWSGPVRVA